MTTFTIKAPDRRIKREEMSNYIGHVVSVDGYPRTKFLVVQHSGEVKVLVLNSTVTPAFGVQNINASLWENHGKLEVTE